MKRKALRIMAGLIAEKRIAITLANSDHAAADVRVLYDSEENVIKDTYPIYHKKRACEHIRKTQSYLRLALQAALADCNACPGNEEF